MNYEEYTPVIENPYPPKWKTVSGFECSTRVRLTRPVKSIKAFNRPHEAQYISTREFVVTTYVDGERHVIKAPEGMFTDLATLPLPARVFAGRVGKHLEAVIMHDYLAIAWQDITVDGKAYVPTKADFRFFNAVLREGLKVAGYKSWQIGLVNFFASLPGAKRAFYGTNPYPRYIRLK